MLLIFMLLVVLYLFSPLLFFSARVTTRALPMTNNTKSTTKQQKTSNNQNNQNSQNHKISNRKNNPKHLELKHLVTML